MPFNLLDEMAAYKRELKYRWSIDWKTEYAKEHHLYAPFNCYGRKVPDISRAPEPPWNRYKDPENLVAIQWGTGFMIITAEAFAKLSPKKLKLLQLNRG